MNTAEFGLTSQALLLSSFPQMRLQQPLQESGTLARRYEALSLLSYSLVSQRPEGLSCNLDALIRPLFDFDFLEIIAYKEGTNEMLWRSVGAGKSQRCSNFHGRRDLPVGVSATAAALHRGLEPG